MSTKYIIEIMLGYEAFQSESDLMKTGISNKDKYNL